MYKIRSYSDFLQSELSHFIASSPEQWQAKVLALLSFRSVVTLDDLVSRSNISDLYILKALLLAEEYGITVRISGGWIMNDALIVNDLNAYLALDIADAEVSDSVPIERLLRNKKNVVIQRPEIASERKATAPAPAQKQKAPASILGATRPRAKEQKKVFIPQHKSQAKHGASFSSFDDYVENQPRPVDGCGRKRSEEWNANEALKLDRQLKERIAKMRKEKEEEARSARTPAAPKAQKPKVEEKQAIEEEASEDIVEPNKAPKLSTPPRVSADIIKGEKLYIELCIKYPDYEEYLTRHHEMNRSFRAMQFAQAKIRRDMEQRYFEDLDYGDDEHEE